MTDLKRERALIDELYAGEIRKPIVLIPSPV